MCWVTDKIPIKLIAESDIPVKKILHRKRYGLLHSPYYRCIWSVGETKVSTLDRPVPCISDINYEIGEGLHSCKELHKYGEGWYCGDAHVLGSSCFDVICDCVIPAGAEYYINEIGLYVSNRLRLCDIC